MSAPPTVQAGDVYGQLTVIRYDHTNRTRARCYLCRCSCGSMKVVRGVSLRSGNTRSCGCLRGGNNRVHGHADPYHPSSTYQSWKAMRARCRDPKNASYALYGGREDGAIRVCERWNRSFAAFLEDMGERPEGKTIDRVWGKGNYSCGRCDECIANDWLFNCKWSTDEEQANNRRPPRRKAP